MRYNEIAVMADFTSSGIWGVVDGGTKGAVHFEELGIPKELEQEFEDWIDFYDRDCHEPHRFVFKVEKTEELNKRGMELAIKLKRAIPNLKVYYRGETYKGMLPLKEITKV